jgi:hypothetical protein
MYLSLKQVILNFFCDISPKQTKRFKVEKDTEMNEILQSLRTSIIVRMIKFPSCDMQKSFETLSFFLFFFCFVRKLDT